MTQNSKTGFISNRKFIAVLITLVIIAAQFAMPLTTFAASAGTAKVVLLVPADVTLDTTNGLGKTTSQYDGLVVTMKQGIPTGTYNENNVNNLPTIDPLFTTLNKIEYLFTTPGTYSFYSRGPGYYRVLKQFHVSSADIEAGNEIEIPIPNGPLSEEGYQIGQWQSFAERKAPDYTGQDFIPATVEIDGEIVNNAVALSSNDYMAVVYTDELRALFDVTPEAFAKQKALSGNTNEPRFPYPEGGLDSVILKNRDKLGMYQIAPNTLLEEFIGEKLISFTQGAGGVYVYYTSLCQSPVYKHEMPFLVFSKDAGLATAESLDAVAKIISENNKPTVWHQGSIHADEPAGTEGATAMISELLGSYGADILDDINVIVLPRVSVDSSKFFTRANFLNADPNRGHLNGDSPEQVVIHQVFQKFMPEVAIDGHEFGFNYNSFAGNFASGYYMTNIDDLQTSEAGQMNISDDLQALSARVNDSIHQNALDAGLRVNHYGPAVSPGVGRAYYNLLGTCTILVEVRGIGAGSYSHMERRAFGEYVAAKSIYQYAADNAEEVKQVVGETRESLVNRGKTYDPDDLISLDYTRNETNYTAETSPRILPRYPFNMDGTLTRPLVVNDKFSLGSYYRSTRDRTRPTAYVMSLDAPNLAKIRKVLDAQSIYYYVVAPGTTIDKLSQYYWVSGTGTANWRADLRSEGSVTMDNGALIVPMDQVNSAVIAMTFEPDYNDSSSYRTTFVQQGLLTRDANDNNNYPLYRYQGDNPSDIAPAVKYDLVLDTDAHFIRSGDTFEVDTYFNEGLESNAIAITYTFDGDVFEYNGFTSADGVTVFNEEYGSGYALVLVGLAEGYEMTNLGKLVLKATDAFTGYQSIQAWAQLALKNELGEKELVGAAGATSIVCYDAPEFYTVVDLSNILDWVGVDNKALEWNTKYVFYDFDNNGIIDIYDVAYLAKLVKAI